jgi:hypothetical protein
MQINGLSRNIVITLCSVLLFIFCFLVASLIDQNTFYKFFSAISIQAIEGNKDIIDKAGYYYDVSAYASMSLADQCQAFYPMFSWLTRYLFHPQTFEQAVIGLKTISCVCFIIGISLFFNLIKRITNNNIIAYLLTFIYTISPMAIFRVIGYTEGFFAILCLIFLSLIINAKINRKYIYFGVFFTAFIMSLTRPISLQLIFSASTTLIIIAFIEKSKNKLGWEEISKVYR